MTDMTTIGTASEQSDTVLGFGDGEPSEFTDGEPNPRCMWSDGVCTNTPTHYINHLVAVAADGTRSSEAETLCGVHYVLTIHKLIAEHSCVGHTAAAHLLGYGEL